MNSMAKRHVRAGQVGIALTHLNTKSVAALPVSVPSFAKQQRIVAEVERRLSMAEEVEAALTANLHRAQRLRQSILKQAFADRLTAQDPVDESASAILERIRTERPKAEVRRNLGRRNDGSSSCWGCDPGRKKAGKNDNRLQSP